MQDRMLRAQMEVSLFSNAIANACEELEIRSLLEKTKSHLDECESELQCLIIASNTSGLSLVNTKTLDAVKAVENVRACSAPSLVRLGCFQPPSQIIDKCNAWLVSSSCFQDTTKVDVSGKSTFPQPLEPEYLPIVSAIPILWRPGSLTLCSPKIYFFCPLF
jgi:hypothetical protein